MDNLAHDEPARLRGAPAVRRDSLAREVELLGSLNVRRTVLRVLTLLHDRVAEWAVLVLEDSASGRVQLHGGYAADLTRTRRRAGDHAPVPALVPPDGRGAVRVDPERLRLMLEPAGAYDEVAGLAGGILALPLQARQGRLGLLLVGRATARPFDEETLAELEATAQRTAVALESAMVYERHARATRVLEDSLRPPTLPQSGTLEVAACFRPAADHLDIGGDFYDLHGEDGDRVLVLGDVCGKGVEAAVLNGRARQTIRTAVRFGHEPGPVLSTLNEVLCEEGTDRFVTVACARLRTRDDGGLTVDVATAGHPPPLVVRADGRVEEPQVRGRLAGVIPDSGPYEQVTLGLAPGDTLVLYTDGVNEARGPDGFFGVDRLRALLGRYAGAGARAVCEAIEQAVVEHLAGQGHDDVTAVAVTPRTGSR